MVAWLKALIVVGSLVVVTTLKLFVPSYEDDNVYEEMVEQIIQVQTDIDIDLTPMSPEDEKNEL